MSKGKIISKKNNSQIFFSIKLKLLFIISAVIICFLIIQSLLYRYYIVHQILEEEMAFASKTVSTIQNAIHSDLRQIDTVNRDWASWDIMYEGVESWNTSFQEDNVPEESLFDLSINILAVLDKNLTPLYSICSFPADNGKISEFKLNSEFIELSRFVMGNNIFSGILKINDTTIYISAYPILQTSGEGTPHGVLIMAKEITNEFISSIGHLLNEKIVYYNGPDRPLQFNEINNLLVKRLGQTFEIIIPINDYKDQVACRIHVEIKRNLFDFIHKSTLLYTIVSLLIFLLFVVILILSVEKLALKRISSLSHLMMTFTDKLPGPDTLTENSHDEITALQNSYNQMVFRLEKQELERKRIEQSLVTMEKLATAGKVTYHILHEINNPIRVIKNCLYALEKEPDDSQEIIKYLKKEVNHLGQITNQMLDFSRSGPVDTQKVTLTKVLDESIQSVVSAFPDKTSQIVTEYQNNHLYLMGNAVKIRQVFVNLIKNALESSDFKEPVIVEAGVDNDVIYSKIKDKGPGISGNQLEKIFEPFFTENKSDGIGLGLSISYNIIKNHGGDIYVDPTYTDGACFVVTFPKWNTGD